MKCHDYGEFDSPSQIARFEDVSVWVVGDLMLDVFWHGSAHRISPEAPCPVVEIDSIDYLLGGAANVAANCAGLGADVSLFGYLGVDSEADRICEICAVRGIAVHTVRDPDCPTTSKTRIVSGTHQIVRMDREVVGSYLPSMQMELIERMSQLNPPDVVIVADYAKGCISRELLDFLGALRPRPTIVADPKRSELEFYAGCGYLKPNSSEASIALGCDLESVKSKSSLCELSKRAGNAAVLLTCGSEGMALYETCGKYTEIPSIKLNVIDVVGAGDAAGAAFSVSIAAGLLPEAAARIANLAGALAVGHAGTYAVSQFELWKAIRSVQGQEGSLSVDRSTAIWLSRMVRRNQGTVVFTNGCFDLLHAGHVHLLNKAKQLGDILLVGLNSDASVRRLKGDDRPIVPIRDRITMLSALSAVDAIIVYDEDMPTDVIRAVMPNFLVKGGDYTPDQVAGAESIEEWGGKVEIIPLLEGRSSTLVRQAIASNQ